jgi:hypothetical protein
MVIYRHLGDAAQKEFSSTWGLGVAFDNVAQFKDVAMSALNVALLMIVLEELHIIGNTQWFDAHVDHLCTQSALFGGAAGGWLQQTATLLRLQRRIVG